MECQTLSIEDAAKALGISRAAAYTLASRGELPVLRLGRRMVIPKARFEAFLAGTPVEQSS